MRDFAAEADPTSPLPDPVLKGRGVRDVMLYTDADKVSNSIYRKIGYRPVADVEDVHVR